MKKRILSMALIVCMVCPFLATTAFALPKNVTTISIPEGVRGAAGRPSEGLMAVGTKDEDRPVGYMDYKGKLVIPRQFEVGNEFHEGLAVVIKDGKYGAINGSGTMVVPNIYQWAGSRFWDGLLPVKKDGKKGMVNASGTVVIPLIYDEIACKTIAVPEGRMAVDDGAFENGLLFVTLNGRKGAIDRNNNIVIPFQFSSIDDEEENILLAAKWVTVDGKIVIREGAIDRAGNTVIPFVYDKITTFLTEGMFGFKKDGKCGVYDIRTRQEFFTADYDEMSGFHNGFARVTKDEKYGYINRTGQEIIPPIYDAFSGDFEDGCALLAKRPAGATEGNWGYINSAGTPITKFEYASAYPFREGLATASFAHDQHGVINTKGETVIPFKNGYIGPFDFGRATKAVNVGTEGDFREGIIDKTGATIVSSRYTAVNRYSDFGTGDGDAYTLVTSSYLDWGGITTATYSTIDRAGKTVKPYGFSSIEEFSDGITAAHSAKYNDHPIAWIINNDYKAYTNKAGNPSVTFPCNKSTILVNGQSMSFEGYTLMGSNYFKLRDLAQALNGTTGQFNVTWDGAKGAVNIIPGEAYTAVGGEMAAGDGKNKSAAPAAAKTYIRGKDSKLVPIVVGGNNYYILRELMEQLGVTVGWDGATNTISLTTKTAEQAKADGQVVAGTIQDGVYAIKSVTNSAIGLSVSGASKDAGGYIRLYTTSEEPHYKFTITSLGGDQYTISPLNSGLMITSPLEKGKALRQQPADGSAAQKITITYQGDGTYRMTDSKGLFLAASGGKIENNVDIILWTRTEEDSQRFLFEQTGT